MQVSVQSRRGPARTFILSLRTGSCPALLSASTVHSGTVAQSTLWPRRGQAPGRAKHYANQAPSAEICPAKLGKSPGLTWTRLSGKSKKRTVSKHSGNDQQASPLIPVAGLSLYPDINTTSAVPACT
ncbi:hypothetical protein E2C01_014007 [Portunus trituberculatus]|uniref:Uncharacterized protein n=1 Tax=Portunus trituberculatus TaxID=210409 RepID=A0A5B7DIR2_PORTR|nr:hypothetical protein [Portunus trituberculatus]